MNNGIYSALAGLLARTQDFEIVSNNLANASSPGYRAQRSFFETLETEQWLDEDIPQAIPGQFGVLGGAYVDSREGHFETTGNPLDLALEGPGYFMVQTSRGLRYTRNGQFHVDSENRLVTSAGDAVVGDQGPIQLPPGPVSISASGMISAQGAIAGQIKIVEFPAGAKLRPEGSSYLATESQASDATAGPPATTTLQQGSIESSNISPVEGTVEMVTLQRQTEMLERTLMIFHSEFDRIAAEELPKAL
jgi:flagellar basal-body rod protein FlgF